jgi:hypothetical protein
MLPALLVCVARGLSLPVAAPLAARALHSAGRNDAIKHATIIEAR